MGKKLQGSARDSWTEILLKFGNLLPHYPGVTVIKPARLPPPARLTGDRDLDALACLQAYTSTAAHFFPSIRRQARRPHSLESLYALPLRTHRVLDRAARYLHETNTQPMVWCAWSMRGWRIYGPRYKSNAPPPTAWVFGMKRLTEKSQLFVWTEGGELARGRLVFAPAHKTLIARYDALRQSLMEAHLEHGLTEKRVSKIVDELLSEREYASLLRRAQIQTQTRQEEIDHALACGEYLWD